MASRKGAAVLHASLCCSALPSFTITVSPHLQLGLHLHYFFVYSVMLKGQISANKSALSVRL